MTSQKVAEAKTCKEELTAAVQVELAAVAYHPHLGCPIGGVESVTGVDEVDEVAEAAAEGEEDEAAMVAAEANKRARA